MTTEQLVQAIGLLPPDLQHAVNLIVSHGMEPKSRYDGNVGAAKRFFVELCFQHCWPTDVAKYVWELSEACLRPHDDIPF